MSPAFSRRFALERFLGISEEELFQNQSLRPILKLQNDISDLRNQVDVIAKKRGLFF